MLGSIKARMLEAFRTRMLFILGCITVCFAIILVQLVNVQLVRGEEFARKSRMNMENNIPIPAARGEIYDRNFDPNKRSVVIVSNRPSFNVTTVPANFRDNAKMEATVRLVCKLLKVNGDEVINEIKARNPWERITIKEDVPFESIVSIATHQDKFPFIDWEDSSVRVYNHANMFAHVVGYIGLISKEEYSQLKNQGYKQYQRIGKSGIESQYDKVLRGRDGYIRRIVDVRNRVEAEEIGLEPQAGNNLVLTIDYGIQQAAYEAMENYMGAAIVVKAATGEVLAMVSRPDFDPNSLISRNKGNIIQQLINDPLKPFINRAIQSRFPPASTFKIITAIAALEEERWNPSTTLFCNGSFTLRGFVDTVFFDYRVHGSLNLYWAIARSCSVYFYQLGLRIGPTAILNYATHFGFDQQTGIDLPGEITGFVPSKRWKLRVFGQAWYDGDTVNLSIGQGFITVTPIEMVNVVAGIVNNGIVYRPYLVREVRSPDNRTVIQSFTPQRQREIPISPSTLSIIREGMRLAVVSGTCSQLSRLPIPIAGKTGTAQTRSNRYEEESQHGWFIGYAPYDGPPEKTVIVIVFVEYGRGGAAAAVPVAYRIFSKMIQLGYFG